MNFKLTLEYDGAEFAGWQQQAGDARTVQGVLRETLCAVAAPPQRLMGAGRTDAGVHARGQVVSALVVTALDAPTLARALNAKLPRDVAVRAACRVRENFDARRDARSKHYRYRVWNARVRAPLLRARSAHEPAPLNICAMAQAARALCGRHDFSSLQAAGATVRSAERTLTRVTVSGERGGEIRFDFEGDGFLRHMVRTAVGTLLEVGRGRRAASSIAALLKARGRRPSWDDRPRPRAYADERALRDPHR